ncbi:MAG: hypothetical protein JJE42_15740 [Burkholderiales bacterium]|nr:hypothetical protein [Burkholderiales bacterium]
MLEVRAQQALRARPFREWLQPDGAVWMQFYRTDAGYLLRFPELADFEVSGDALAVACRPAPDVSEETTRHLFLNQVLPLVLSKRGKLVFHASAVEVSGAAVAFVADSGRGKSTLAASFAAAGYRFLCDDGLVLERRGAGYDAMPSHPSIRLWQDSQEALVGAGAQTVLPVQYTAKARLLAGEGMAFCGEPRALRRVYFLGDGGAPGVTLQKLGAGDALGEWMKHSFLLDIEERPLLASHFDQLAVLASRPIAYRLDFPRRYDALEAVRQAIVVHINEADGEA